MTVGDNMNVLNDEGCTECGVGPGQPCLASDKYIIEYTQSELEDNEDIEMFADDIRDGNREVYDDNGNVIDPSTLTEAQIRQFAEDEMGDGDYSVMYVYDQHTMGTDKSHSMEFDTEAEARAFIAGNFAHYPGTWDVL